MKLKELKIRVYDLAKVKSTKELKSKYTEFKTLDMRRKVSWEAALKSLEKLDGNFEAWLENPPAEYKELFSEIQEVSKKYDQGLSKTKHLVQNIQSVANSLEVAAEELIDEATQLDRQNKIAHEVNKQAKLN